MSDINKITLSGTITQLDMGKPWRAPSFVLKCRYDYFKVTACGPVGDYVKRNAKDGDRITLHGSLVPCNIYSRKCSLQVHVWEMELHGEVIAWRMGENKQIVLGGIAEASQPARTN